MADPDEIREWGRANGHDVKDRGRISAELAAAYDHAHPTLDELDPDNSGVTEADFPPADDGPAQALDGSPARPGTRKAPRERKPRVVKGKPAAPRKNWRQLWGNATRPKPRGARTDLSDFASDVWSDFAMITAGIPPVSRVLTLQAPYVGVVFDEAVRGLPMVDTLLQPVAKASVSIRALNGLIGPPVLTMAICAQGNWETTDTGAPVITPDGRPVPDQRTAMMLGALRYSLAQMARTADVDKVRERAEQDAERMAAVDRLIDFILGFPAATQKAPGQASPSPQEPGQAVIHPTQVFTYPKSPVMDETGMPQPAAAP